MSTKPRDDDFSEQETQERFEATLRGALKTPPQPRPTKKAAHLTPVPAVRLPPGFRWGFKSIDAPPGVTDAIDLIFACKETKKAGASLDTQTEARLQHAWTLVRDTLDQAEARQLHEAAS